MNDPAVQAGASAEEVATARQVFDWFSKCHNNLKLYPHYHVNCVEPLDRFIQGLCSYVEAHDTLRIKVHPDRLELGEAPIYESKGRENLALAFYMDGLRELAIQPGLSKEAAKDLLFLFHKTVLEGEADSLLFLWEADIPNVDYTALNSLMDPWEPPDYFAPEQVQHLKQMNEEAEAIVEALTKYIDCEEHEIAPGPHATAEREPPVPGTAHLLQALGDPDDDVFETYGEDLAELRSSLLTWTPSKLLVNVVGHTFDGLVLAPEVVDAESAEWLFRRSLDLAIEARDPELLADLLERFRGERDLAEEESAEKLLESLFEDLQHKEFIDRLIGMVKGGLQGSPEALGRALGCLGPQGYQAAVAIYRMPRPAALGPPLLEFISANLATDPSAVEPLLTPQTPATSVAGLLDGIEKYVRDDALLTRLLNAAREHPDVTIKARANKLWHKRTAEGQVEILSKLLASPKLDNRLSALQRIVDMNLVKALPQLKAQVESAEFLQRGPKEKRAFFDAIRKLGGVTAVAFLQNQTKRSTGLFSRKAVKEVRGIAQESLDALRDRRHKETP